MKKLFIYPILLYQYTISPDHGIVRKIFPRTFHCCVFYPTCSEYAILAIEKHGVIKGIGKTVRRILRCYPKQKAHIDFP